MRIGERGEGCVGPAALQWPLGEPDQVAHATRIPAESTPSQGQPAGGGQDWDLTFRWTVLSDLCTDSDDSGCV